MLHLRSAFAWAKDLDGFSRENDLVERKYQATDQAVDVRAWREDNEFSPYPKGSREKSALYCPEDPGFSFLIPKHRYLFKHSSHRYPDQFWVEVAAYIVGCFMNVSVPPAFVGYNSNDAQCCALIEWFYDYPEDHPTTRYVEGGEYMTRFVSGYDRKKGEQHNFRTVTTLSKRFAKAGKITDNWIEHWSRVFVFDALIGNTDRHQDNWGLIWKGLRESTSAKFAPAFDNGTAMGHERMERDFAKFNEVAYLERYVSRGKHHMRWRLKDAEQQSHAGMLLKIRENYPGTEQIMLESLRFDPGELENAIMELTDFDVPVPLSEARACFMMKILRYRQQRLIRLLNE